MMGAGRLAVLGALRGGAGLVTWGVPSSEYAVAAAGGPWEAMTLPLPSSAGSIGSSALKTVLNFLAARGVTAVVAGPGFSTHPSTRDFSRRLAAEVGVPLVLDADGLNALSGGVSRRAPWIITPHPGEAARLLKTTAASVQRERLSAARSLSEIFGAVALLKGAGTLVVRGRTVFKNRPGHPAMATGGMGDVLAGLIGALIPQVRARDAVEACLRAAVLGAWIHGRAGEKAAGELGPQGLTASELAGRMPSVFKEILC
jgi:hydroxyethylthiazole kinase-like uncharacterized protein yjeF